MKEHNENLAGRGFKDYIKDFKHILKPLFHLETFRKENHSQSQSTSFRG